MASTAMVRRHETILDDDQFIGHAMGISHVEFTWVFHATLSIPYLTGALKVA